MDGLSQTILGRRGQDEYPGLPRLPRGCAGGPCDSLGRPRSRRRAHDRRGGSVRVARAPTPGHTHWCNGNTFYDGLTTALAPNTKSLAGLPAADSDFVSEDEDDGGPTYSAVTARSYHSSGVNCPVRRRQRTIRQEFDCHGKPGERWGRSAEAK